MLCVATVWQRDQKQAREYIKITIFSSVKAYSSIHKHNLRNNYGRTEDSPAKWPCRAAEQTNTGRNAGSVGRLFTPNRWAFCRRISEAQSSGSGNLICNETYQFGTRRSCYAKYSLSIDVMNNIRNGGIDRRSANLRFPQFGFCF